MEHKELFACKINMTSSAYCHYGIYPFDLKYNGWTNVIDTLGKFNNELKERNKGKRMTKYEVVVNTTAIVTKDEKNTSHR